MALSYHLKPSNYQTLLNLNNPNSCIRQRWPILYLYKVNTRLPGTTIHPGIERIVYGEILHNQTPQHIVDLRAEQPFFFGGISKVNFMGRGIGVHFQIPFREIRVMGTHRSVQIRLVKTLGYFIRIAGKCKNNRFPNRVGVSAPALCSRFATCTDHLVGKV